MINWIDIGAVRIPLKGGYEHDALSQWRHYMRWRPGLRKYNKTKYNRRFRKLNKRIIIIERAQLMGDFYGQCEGCVYCIAGYICGICHPCNICSRLKNGKVDYYFNLKDAQDYLDAMDRKEEL